MGRAKGKPKRVRVKRTRTRTAVGDPMAAMLDQCRLGKHPPSRRIGRGCAVCGSDTAWR